MVWVITVISILIAFLGLYRYKHILNPVTVMFGLWAVILPLSDFGFYETLIPSDKTYLIIACGLASFLMGICLADAPVRLRRRRGGKTEGRATFQLNYLFLYLIIGVSLVYYLIQSVEIVKLLAAGNTYHEIRILATSNEVNVLNRSRVLTAIKAFVTVPTTYLTIALAPVEFFFGKRNKAFLCGSFLMMFFYVFTSGGRSVILWLAVYFVCVFLFYWHSVNYDRSVIRRFLMPLAAGGLVLLAFLFVMTLSRKGSDVDFVQQFFIYFVAPVPHFSRYIDVVDASGKVGLGLSSFYGLIYPALFLLRMVIGEYPAFALEIYHMSFQMMEKGTDIGGGIYMNAFVTAFYQPYLDGRILGVIIILALFGFFSGVFFKGWLYRKDLRALLLYLLLLQKIMFSVVRFYFTQQAQAMCFILALFAIRRIVIPGDGAEEKDVPEFGNYTDLRRNRLY